MQPRATGRPKADPWNGGPWRQVASVVIGRRGHGSRRRRDPWHETRRRSSQVSLQNSPAVPTPRRISAARKFIPNGDSDLSTRAWTFAQTIAKDPAALGVAQADSDELTARAA